MLRRTIIAGVLGSALALGLLGSQGASAATTAGVQVFGSFNTHAMDDVNAAIEADNQNGYAYEELDGGFTGGAGLRVRQGDGWAFDLTWEPLFLETEDAANGSKWNMDAHSIQLGAAYFFPGPSRLKLGAGGGVGLYSVTGENEDPSQIPSRLSVEGSGVGYHLLAVGEWAVSPGFAVIGGAGYRMAEVEIDGSTNDSTVDYSGFTGRLGLALYFPSR